MRGTPAPADDESERKKFEEWQRSRNINIDLSHDGADYLNQFVAIEWTAWQHRAGMAQDLQLTERIGSLAEENGKLRSLLNYVFYARLPLGDKVEDHIPDEWAIKVIEALTP